jgi:hypothetical protein
MGDNGISVDELQHMAGWSLQMYVSFQQYSAWPLKINTGFINHTDEKYLEPELYYALQCCCHTSTCLRKMG